MIRNVLGVIAGIVIGSLVNGALINLGHHVVSLPPGADVSTMENLAIAMKSFGPEQFVFPFLAHAIGTLVGALIAVVIASSHKFAIAIGIGVLFLIGGVTAGIMIGSPMWYNVIDFVFAYIPMALIGAKLGGAGK